MDRRHFLLRGVGASLAASIALPVLVRAAPAPIVVGQSAAMTGPQAGFGTAMRDGIQAALTSANKAGGVNGRTLQLLTLDDQGDKARTEANVRTLVDDQRVVALTGFTTRPCAEAGALMAAKDNIALVGAFSGTPLLYGEKAPTTFTTRASYEQEMEATVHHYRQLGTQRFGFLHLDDARSTNVPLLEGILARQGGQLVVTAGVDRKGPSLNAAAMKTLEANPPEMLIVLANNAPLTSLLREYAPRTLILPKSVISFVDREKLLADLGKGAAGVGFSVVVPEYSREKYWIVRDFLAQARESSIPVTPVSLEGFVTGLAVTHGLKQARTDTRAAFIEGMTRVSALDLGYTNLRFGRNQRAGSRFVDLSMATRSSSLI
jgi:branched-chain amino acid transport system substrate-binding protein